jgi:hypothetical protein
MKLDGLPGKVLFRYFVQKAEGQILIHELPRPLHHSFRTEGAVKIAVIGQLEKIVFRGHVNLIWP